MKVGMRKGFSLIEIGIVMVVIGLIIAAVMKGKDVIKSAEIKKVNQEFFNKWVNATDGYFDKTGLHLDSSADTGDGAVQAVEVAKFAAAGVKTPVASFDVVGESTDTKTVNVGWLEGQQIDASLKRNMVYFTNLPGDIAISLDKLVDGTASGTAGKCRIVALNDAATDFAQNVPTTTLATPTENGFDEAATGMDIAGTNMDPAATYDVVIVLEH